jgi:hypothetical protein
MKTEKVVLSFIAVLLGLVVAGIAYFVYQSTKSIPSSKIPTITIAQPSPTPQSSVILSVDQPTDNAVVTSRTLTINGKTNPDATIILTTSSDDQIVTPASNGNYSVTTTIASGENQILVTAIGSNGEETSKKITITYSTEDF